MLNTIKKMLGVKPATDFKQLLEDGAVILDVRSPGEYRSGHAKGALNVPLGDIGEYARKQKDKSQVIITCCASGMRSGNAKGQLESAGFASVYNAGPWQNLNF